MADLLRRLEILDRRRERVDTYMLRCRMAFFMPATRDRLLAGLGKKFRAISDERARVLSLINADPHLRQRNQEREGELLAGALNASPTEIAKLTVAERAAKSAYQQAVWYEKDGAWRTDGIPHGLVATLVTQLKDDYRRLAEQRAALQNVFERRMAAQTRGDPKHILMREQELERAITQLKHDTAPAGPDRFQQWLSAHGILNSHTQGRER